MHLHSIRSSSEGELKAKSSHQRALHQVFASRIFKERFEENNLNQLIYRSEYI